MKTEHIMLLQQSLLSRKIKQLASWFDIHGLFILSAFLIVFIPLFPKIPIFDVLPGYIVRARPDDVLVLITALVWIKDALKKRFPVSSTYFWIVVLYAISGSISILLGTFLTQSIPVQLLHIGKSGLHLFRYLEYFAMFFFTYSSVKTLKQLKIILSILACTILIIVLYGFGQEYFHFPLFSTMNREYSKGTILYLQEGARPQSTFAGHYDLAAYLVIVLPIIFSVSLSLLKINFKQLKKTLWQKTTLYSVLLQFVHVLGAWMLVTSGSKTALLAYIIGILIVLFYYLRTLGNWKQQLKWGSISLVLLAGALTLFLTFFAQSTRDKFISLIKTTFSRTDVPISQNATPDDLVGDGVVFKQITVKNDDGTERKEWIEEQSTWSQNALKYGLSMGIRLDTLWPNALKGFINNPLFGNGYATLVSISNPGEYSTAESTDNNFLRTIGETGLFGFITFYGLIVIIVIEIIKSKKSDSLLTNAVKIGFLGSIFGLLINATYIDVFAASKVAYTFWAFTGITLAALRPKPLASIKSIKNHLLKQWPIYFALIISLFLLHKNPFHEYALIKNLDVSDAQIESLTAAHCFVTKNSFDLCTNTGLSSKNGIALYSVLLVPFLKINSNPMMFYFLNLTIVVMVLIGIYFLLPRILNKYGQTKPKQFLVFSTLSLYVIIVTALQLTTKPLTTLELLSFGLLLPILLIIYTVLIHKIYYQLAYLTQITAVLIALLFLVNSNYNYQFLNQFRNNQISDKYTVINLANVHFDLRSYLNREKEYLLITTLNPYYVDLFSNGHYSAAPLSESQTYYSKANTVYNLINSDSTLIEQYTQLAQNAHLFVTDFQVRSNETFNQAFESLKQRFDLSYVAIGCNDTCNLFELQPETTRISPEPLSINTQNISLDSLENEYSFSVISNRYEPRTVLDGADPKKYTTTEFSSFLNVAVPKTNAFAVITGDITHDTGPTSDSIFKKYVNYLPVLYTSGNFSLQSSKQYPSSDAYFYTDSEFFIFLTVTQDSQVSDSQQLFLYNALLKIEKLPQIKSIFVVAHELNWEERSDSNNFIFELERKLSQFTQTEKYIITSKHSQETNPELLRSESSITHILDPETNIHYLSSYVRGWPNDSYFEFRIKADNSVEILERFRQ